VKGNCFRRNTVATIRSRYGLADAAIIKNVVLDTMEAAAIVVDRQPGSTNERPVVSRSQSRGDATFAVIVGTVDSRQLRSPTSHHMDQGPTSAA
jgi:hypothetical protein